MKRKRNKSKRKMNPESKPKNSKYAIKHRLQLKGIFSDNSPFKIQE